MEFYKVGHAGLEFALSPLAEITILSHALRDDKAPKPKNVAKSRKQFMPWKINYGSVFFMSFLSISLTIFTSPHIERVISPHYEVISGHLVHGRPGLTKIMSASATSCILEGLSPWRRRV